MMKGIILKIISLSVIFSFALTAAVSATTEQKGIKYTKTPDSGLPVETIASRIPYTNDYTYTYKGKKTIPLNFDTPGITLSASSESRSLSAWIWDGKLSVENNGLALGESAYVTVTASHKDYEPVSQKIKISITDGSAEYPHIVTTAEDLKGISELGLNKWYVQGADIDLKGINEWTPIGGDSAAFTGIYDGKGNKIINMNFKIVHSDYHALFGTVSGKHSRIKGVNIEGTVDPYYPGEGQGTVIGKLISGMVFDCHFKGDMTLRQQMEMVGGIVASVSNGGTIEDCSYEGKINVRARDFSHIGGITGVIDGKSDNCVFTGEITVEGKKAAVGGIAGQNNGTISNALVTANLSKYGAGGSETKMIDGSAGAVYVGGLGGIVGENESEILDVSYHGDLYVKGNQNNVGGIAASNTGSISEAVSMGLVTLAGDNCFAGGILGHNINGTVKSITATSDVFVEGKQNRAGGIAGENRSYIDYTNSSYDGKLLASIEAGAFRGTVRIKGTGGFAGGIAGGNIGLTNVSAGKSVTAASIITKCVLTYGEIEGQSAGRIVAENRLETVGYASEATKIHSVSLADNVAINSILVNGAAVTGTTNSINGESITKESLEKTFIEYGITNYEAMLTD